MSIDVLREVLNHSQAKGTDRLVLIALADAANPNGITWLPISPPKSSGADPTKCITHRANCSKREAIRAIQELEQLAEIEVRKAQRGQRRISVYAVRVGSYFGSSIDYENLPFAVSEPFGRGDNLAPRNEADSASLSESEGTSQGDGPGTSRGDEVAPDGVTAYARARREPSLDPAAEPSIQDQRSSSSVAPPATANDGETAAAPSEPVSIESAAASLARLRGWDQNSIKVVEPLMCQLPAAEFVATIDRTLARRNVENPAGLFVFLLRTAIGEWRKAQTDARLATWDGLFGDQGIEHVKRTDPERYILAWAQAPVDVKPLPSYAVLPHVLDYLFEYIDDVDERRRLADLYDKAAQQQPSLATIRDWILVGLERRHYHLDEVIETIATLAPGNDELLTFAREVAANIAGGEEQVA